MKERDRRKLQNFVREVVKEELPIHDDRKELVKCIRESREALEVVTAKLEDLYRATRHDYPEMSDWARGIVEDHKDVYQELMDFETEIRT